ncbi:MAG: alpha/beta hydrolase fold domain-containing protein [Candidatus Latescibacteria bacterium]|nr:alpha/beta hydrolase fold domain-containing protein [Candidatus Latescibacterota bacterium]
MLHKAPSSRDLTATVVLLAFLLSTRSGAAPDGQAAGAFWSHRFRISENLAYGDDPAQKLDLYLQGSWIGEPTYFQRAPDKRPTLIFIHGGGWIRGDKTGSDPPLFLPFVERGWHVVNINYRLGKETAPAAIDDAVCALSWVVNHADDYGFDLDNIVVSGASAGGHLALMAGIMGSRPGHPCYPGDDFTIAAVINWYGITDVRALARHYSQTRPKANFPLKWVGKETSISQIPSRYSPIELVGGRVPPVLSIHGTDDSVVPHDQAINFHKRLEELGALHQLQSLQGGKHVGFSDAQFQQAFGAIFSFLDHAGIRR